VNPLERPRGPNRRPRVPAKPVPGVHADPFDEPGHHRALTRVEVDYIRVDPGLSRDLRVVLLCSPVYIVGGTFSGKPQHVSRAARRHLVTDVGESTSEQFEFDVFLSYAPEHGHAF
jgi:hypothetical protein